MAWHAVDSVEPAFDRTVGLLFKPVRARFWLKLALVVLLMGFGAGGGGGGSGGNFSNFRYTAGREDLGNLPELFVTKVMENIGIIAAAVGILILLALVLSYIRVVMQFVFLESVLNSRVEIRDGFRRHMGKGFRLFLFELAVGIIFISCMIIPVLAYYFIFGISFGMALWLSLAIWILALILLVILMSIVMSFTKSFVVPYMYKGRGLIEGWKHLLSLVRKNIDQTVVYVLMRIVLAIVSGIVGLVITIPVLLILLIPGIIIALLFIMLGGGIALSGICSGPMLLACIAAAILLLIPVVLVVSYLLTLVQLPIPVFFRYYTLIFLTKIDKGFEIPGIGKIAKG